VAKALSHLDPSEQWNTWQTRMSPLLTAEEALDKPN
jgi:hypothetical protein